MKLTDREWKPFKISDLFSCLTSKNTIEEDLGAGGTRYITRTAENNGCAGHGASEHTFEGNCITVGAEGRYAFYQDETFSTGNKIYRLINPRLNKYNAMFLCTVINKSVYKYSYGRARVLEKIKQETIALPATSDGNPDWQYMEDYIKSLHHKPIRTKKSIAMKRQDLNPSVWKLFKVGDLFSCATSKNTIEEDLGAGSTRYITRTAENNGCSRHGVSDYVFEGNCITIGAEGRYAFYQDETFSTGNKIYRLINPRLNKYNAMFICTVLNKSVYKYSYGRARVLEKIKQETLALPATSAGNPDWRYMEDYIKSLSYSDRI